MNSSPKIIRLLNEYQASMSAEIVHSWAADIVREVRLAIPDPPAVIASPKRRLVGFWQTHPDHNEEGSLSTTDLKPGNRESGWTSQPIYLDPLP